MMKKLLISLMLILLLPVSLYAACVADGDNWASTPDQTSVASCVSQADAGDTITVSAGDGTETWSNPLNITKSIYLIGPGPANLTVTHGYAGTLITISLSTDVDVRISGFYFKQSTNNPGYKAIQINGKTDGSFAYTKIRIDNNKFEKGSRTLQVNGWVEGVIDSNTFLNCNISIGITGDDNRAWTRTIAAGTEHALFIENNTFTETNDADREPNQFIYHQEGARTVTRYNTFDSSAYTNGNSSHFDSHGNQNYYNTGNNAGTFRGQPIIEVYNNIFAAHHSYGPFDIRSGSSLIHHNTFTTVTGTYRIEFWEEEAWSTSHFETGLDTTWPAEDQVTNTFFWANTVKGVTVTDDNIATYLIRNVAADYTFIRDGYELFAHEPASSGGKSTYTDRLGAAGNSTDGTLSFSAEGANAYYPYTIYTCPHPLVDPAATGNCNSSLAGVTGYSLAAGPPSLSSATLAADGVTLSLVFTRAITATINTGVTVTPSSGVATAAYTSGSTSTTLVYTLSRAISSTANGGSLTVAYTQPGNGLEATDDGQDVATFPSTAVTNNSEQGNTLKTVTPSVVGTGCHIYPDTAQTIVSGLTTSFTYAADANYQLSAWGGTCGGTGTTTYTTSAITEDCTVTVSCTKIAADNKVGSAGLPGHRVGAGNPAHKRY